MCHGPGFGNCNDVTAAEGPGQCNSGCGTSVCCGNTPKVGIIQRGRQAADRPSPACCVVRTTAVGRVQSCGGTSTRSHAHSVRALPRKRQTTVRLRTGLQLRGSSLPTDRSGLKRRIPRQPQPIWEAPSSITAISGSPNNITIAHRPEYRERLWSAHQAAHRRIALRARVKHASRRGRCPLSSESNQLLYSETTRWAISGNAAQWIATASHLMPAQGASAEAAKNQAPVARAARLIDGLTGATDASQPGRSCFPASL
jgi:hypothetical protein